MSSRRRRVDALAAFFVALAPTSSPIASCCCLSVCHYLRPCRGRRKEGRMARRRTMMTMGTWVTIHTRWHAVYFCPGCGRISSPYGVLIRIDLCFLKYKAEKGTNDICDVQGLGTRSQFPHFANPLRPAASVRFCVEMLVAWMARRRRGHISDMIARTSDLVRCCMLLLLPRLRGRGGLDFATTLYLLFIGR